MQFGQTLAEYVRGLSLEQVPGRDIEVAKLAIMDQVGVALAGIGEDPGNKVQAMVDRCAANEATILGNPRRTTSWLAAFVNGTLGHTLDFDDTSTMGHPSVVLVPAMLAAGETRRRTGRQMLEAYIAGYQVGEAIARIVPRRPDQFHGLHSTALFGPLTSATVAGRLFGLTDMQQRHAWGIASSQAGGITGNFGTHTKPLHGGIASQAGMTAVELAATGFESNPDAIEAPLGYVYSVVAAGRMEGVEIAHATAALGTWMVADTWRLKKYPCGYIAQGAIDAALAFRAKTGARLDDLTSVEIRVPHLQPYFRVRPTGEFAGKFGYEFPVASAILDGTVLKSSFSDASFHRPELQKHLPKFTTIEDPDSAKQGALGCLVIVANGKTTLQPIDIPLGDARNPAPPSLIIEKYLRNAGEVLGDEVAKTTCDMLLAIETLADPMHLLDLLSKRAA